ncbi:MAG: hypothetical protein WA280_18505 [Xanthobacteraceae bacterium]
MRDGAQSGDWTWRSGIISAAIANHRHVPFSAMSPVEAVAGSGMVC